MDRVAKRADELRHELSGVFNLVRAAYFKAQKRGLDELANLQPLGSRVVRASIVYPGTEKHYTEWERFHESCLNLAADSLTQPGIIEAAATDFVFRVHESCLEFDDDPDRVLDVLLARAKRLGSPTLLLAECALNRYTISMQGGGALATDSTHVVAILAAIGSMGEEFEDEDLRAEHLTFLVFDALIGPHAPLLHSPDVERLARLMDARATELDSMRKKCARQARALVHARPSEAALRSAFKDALDDMREEVQAIIGIDRATFGKMLDKIMEDRVVWTTLGGLIASTVAGQPALMASAALTLFSTLGTSVLKVGRERREVLKSSPWAFLYYLRR